MTRTDLIARLRDPSGADHTLFDDAADMLEADGKLRKAARMALDALEYYDEGQEGPTTASAVISTLKEALK